MTKLNFHAMSRQELRAYVLAHRDDEEAFQALMDKLQELLCIRRKEFVLRSGRQPQGSKTPISKVFNFLKIEEFIEVVKLQPWRELQNFQLLIHDEEDERFTLYTLS